MSVCLGLGSWASLAAPAAGPIRPSASAVCHIAGKSYTYTPDAELAQLTPQSRVFISRNKQPLHVRFYWLPAKDHISVGFEYAPKDPLALRDPPLSYDCDVTIKGQATHQDVVGHHQFTRWRVQSHILEPESPKPYWDKWLVLHHAQPKARAAFFSSYLDKYRAGAALDQGDIEAAAGGNLHKSLWDNAGLERLMGTAGGRKEIGPVDEASAAFVALHPDITGHPFSSKREENFWRLAKRIMMSQAEAVGGMPIAIRDPATGQALILEGRYAQTTYLKQWQGKQGNYIPQSAPDGKKGGWTMDTAHNAGSVLYYPALLTGDPYLVEAAQFMASFCLAYRPPQYRSDKQLFLSNGQYRARAWSLFRVKQAEVLSMPGRYRDYLSRALTNNLNYLLSLNSISWRAFAAPDKVDGGAVTNRAAVKDGPAVNRDGSPARLLKGDAGSARQYSSWQADFMTMAFTWPTLLGDSRWKPVLPTLVKSYQRRFRNPDTGQLNMNEGVAYYYSLTPAIVGHGVASYPPYTSWAQVKRQAQDNPLWPAEHPLGSETQGWGSYHLYAKSALAMLTAAKAPGAKEIYDYVLGEEDRMAALGKIKLREYKMDIEP